MSSSVRQAKCRVLQHECDGDFRRLVFEAPEIAALARPGQFVHLLCGGTHDPLLRRPLSIYRAESDQVAVLYEIRGRGTSLLAEKKPGDSLDVIGPLGTGFAVPESPTQPIVLVGGGIGAPPLYFLANTISKLFGCERLTTMIGAQTAEKHVCADEFRSLSGDNACLLATDDGSCGHGGLVTEILRDRLDSGTLVSPMIYACGPIPMLKAVALIAKEYHLSCQVSLEAKMACGIGACMGCVIKIRNVGGCKYVRVCHEGPVFDAVEVVWDE